LGEHEIAEVVLEAPDTIADAALAIVRFCDRHKIDPERVQLALFGDDEGTTAALKRALEDDFRAMDATFLADDVQRGDLPRLAGIRLRIATKAQGL
jgi:hypothetical protein